LQFEATRQTEPDRGDTDVEAQEAGEVLAHRRTSDFETVADGGARTAYFVTLSLAVAVCVSAPFLPVMVSVKVPRGPDADVRTVSVDAVVAAAGEKVTAAPKGCPARVSATDPENPPADVIATR
jgi:hypothetical protein